MSAKFHTPTLTLPLSRGGNEGPQLSSSPCKGDTRAHISPSPCKGEGRGGGQIGVNRFDRTRAKTANARTLRKNATPAEAKLWPHLRNANLHGVSFRRQHPMGAYVLDFYCPAARLAIELDGGQHNEDSHLRRDQRRDAWFAGKGIKTIRFWNHQVLTGIENVLDDIWIAVDERLKMRTTPSLTLPLSGGGNEGPQRSPSPCKGQADAQLSSSPCKGDTRAHISPSPCKGEGRGGGQHQHRGGGRYGDREGVSQFDQMGAAKALTS